MALARDGVLSRFFPQLIRHGEKVKADRPGLSADGRRRAKCLRKVFGKGPLKAE